MAGCHVAIDIGASSGRHIVGQVVDGRMELTEVYRFENGLTRKDGHLCWDIDALAENVVAGLAAAHGHGFEPTTIGIDTWAVDYVLLDEHDERLGDCVGYRDARTDGVRDALELSGILSFDEHYGRTGIQYQQFNTAYQLCAQSREESRGAHFRSDYPTAKDKKKAATIITYGNGSYQTYLDTEGKYEN